MFGSTPGEPKDARISTGSVQTGSATSQRLTDSPYGHVPVSWHPSGKFLAFAELNPQTNFDLLILPMEGDEASGWKPGKPTVFLNSRFDEREPMFSPDGRWIAYQSNESGRNEVYVQPYPGPGGKWQISTGGGVFPTWSRTARELFFGTPTQQIMVAAYDVEGDAFRAEKPRLWSDARYKLRGAISSVRPAPGRQAIRARACGTRARWREARSRHGHLQRVRRAAPNRAESMRRPTVWLEPPARVKEPADAAPSRA